MFVLTMLSTVLTAVVYHQRLSRHEAHLRTLQAAEDLRQAQARVLLSENAASLGRLAATISHELNSPIGALLSGVDTLLLLGARQATSSAGDQQRMVLLQADVRRTIKESAGRLREIISRMQRFTNLDRAEVQMANLNELLGDVVLLTTPQLKNSTKLELDLQPVPEIVCRPQQLSAVFGNLVNNAIAAVNGDGRITIASRALSDRIEVEIRDNGSGVDAAEIATIFDPGFKVKEGRVLTGNWSLFSSRQIVREHGGDIRIASGKGMGTCVRVTLPFETKTSVASVPLVE
jgi:signal transduction histidine kinase